MLIFFDDTIIRGVNNIIVMFEINAENHSIITNNKQYFSKTVHTAFNNMYIYCWNNYIGIATKLLFLDLSSPAEQ